MRELHLFAGAGGGILGGILLGHTTVCAVEIEPYCRKVLLQRQRDGILPKFPIWDDILTFDGKPWRGLVDVVCGGFPCQDISAAGKGAGIKGERSGLWKEMARVVCEVRPQIVFVENSPMLVTRGMGTVLGDLAAMGFDARWCVLGADNAGAPHIRKRCFILAYSQLSRLAQRRRAFNVKQIEPTRERVGGIYQNRSEVENKKVVANLNDMRKLQSSGGFCDERKWPLYGSWWETEPAMGRLVYGNARRMDTTFTRGNAQVPAVAALAWQTLTETLTTPTTERIVNELPEV